MRRAASVSVLAFLFASTAHAALAQGGSAPASGTALEELVVTAQRREERLQDVPIAVTAISSAALEKQGVTSTAELNAAVPGLSLTKSSTVWQPFLRGVGTQTIQPGSDPSIPVYIDGVYLSAPGALMFSFANIERIEVLKGPQGTLFGRNATGGLIQVVTRDPTAETTAKASVGYGRFNAFNSSAYVSGGTDTVAGSLALIYNKQSDGWGKNLFVPPANAPAGDLYDEDVGVMEEFGAHAKVVVRPDDRTNVKFSAFYVETDGDQYQYRNPGPGQAVLASGTTPYFYTGDFYDTNTDINWNSASQQYLISNESSYQANFATLKSISSYLSARLRFVVPSDAGPQLIRANSFGTPGMTWRTFTQELQLLSNDESGPDWLQWIGGAYYLWSEGTFVQKAGALPSDLDTTRTSSQISESYAVYGQATADLTKRTSLTLGLRFNRDEITASQFTVGHNALAAPTAAAALGRVSWLVDSVTDSFNKLTWKAVLDHHITDDVLAYASVSRGYKAGAWNHGSLCPQLAVSTPTCPTIQPAARPEILDAYELGLKSMLLDNRLRLNLSAYYYDYKDLQVSAVVGIPPVSVINNAASAEIYGLDVEGEARVTSNFSVNFNVALLHSKFKDYPGAVLFTPRTIPPFNAGTSTFNAAGNELLRAPKVTGNLGFNWTIPTESGDFEVSASVYHSGKTYWDPANRLSTKAYELVSAQLAWSPDDTWRVRIWSRNLLGEKYYSAVTATGFGDAVTAAAPRTFGVAVDWKM